MKPTPKQLKRFLPAALVILILLLAGGIYYFNAAVLPARLQALINEKGQSFLGRNIRFDRIRYSPGKGLRLTNLIIFQKDHPDQPLLKIGEVSSKIPLLPLLKDKTVIIPSLVLRDFDILLTKTGPGTWNISDLFAPRAPSTDRSYKILPGKIVLQQGRVTLARSDTPTPTAPITLTVDSASAALSLPIKARIAFSGKIADSETTLRLNGDYFLVDGSFDTTAQTANLDLTNTLGLFWDTPLPVETAVVHTASLRFVRTLKKIECQGDWDADLTAALDDLNVAGRLNAQGFRLARTDEHLYCDIDTFTLHDNGILQFQDTDYTGALTLTAMQLTRENGLFSVTGNLTLSPSSITSGPLVVSASRISIPDFELKRTDDPQARAQDLTLTAALEAPGMTLTTGQTRISGDLSIPKISLETKDDAILGHSPLTLKNAALASGSIITAAGDLEASLLETVYTPDAFRISGLARADGLSFQLPADRSGSLNASEITFNIVKDLTKLAELTYSVKTDISDGKLSNAFLPDFKTLDRIRGIVTVINDTITFQDILLTTHSTRIGINGTLRTFSKFIADLDIQAKDLNIKDWIALARPYLDPYGLTLDGTTNATLRVRGPLTETSALQYTIETDIQQARIRSDKYPWELSETKGSMKYKDNLLSWNDLRFTLNDARYESTGTLKDFQTTPILNMRLQGSGYYLTLNAESSGDEYRISRADIKTKRSNLSGQGSVRLDEQDPYANMTFSGDLAISDLKRLHPKLDEAITKQEIRGEGTLNLVFQGPVKRPLDALFRIKYLSPFTSIKNIKFENLTLEADQAQPRQESLYSAADFYGGKITASGDVTLEDLWPFKGQIRGFDINIAELQKDLPNQQKDVGGTLEASLFAEGPIKDTAAITGQGRAVISNGHFVKTNLLKGILGMILNPDYQDTTFTDAKAKLFIRDNKLKLMDIFLKSNAVDLTGYGWIDIHKNIDFAINPSFKDSLSVQPGLLKSNAETLLEKYSTIHVTGVLGSPKYSFSLSPDNIVGDAADILSNGVQGVLKGLGF